MLSGGWSWFLFNLVLVLSLFFSIVLFIVWFFQTCLSPVFSVLPQGLVFHAQDMVIPWDKIDRITESMKTVRIQTTHDYLPEPELAQHEPFYWKIGSFWPPTRGWHGITGPVINYGLVNRYRHEILAALAHYVGEDKIERW